MKKIVISEEERQKILEMHKPCVKQPGDINELDIWDKDNINALKSHIGLNDRNKLYRIYVEEPFTFETKDSEDFYKFKFILNRSGIPYKDSIEKI